MDAGLLLQPESDLSSIWDFTEARWDAGQAEAYIVEIQEAIERIADDPRRGGRVDEVRNNYRRYVVGSHLVFHIERASSIDVIRILHHPMDPIRYL